MLICFVWWTFRSVSDFHCVASTSLHLSEASCQYLMLNCDAKISPELCLTSLGHSGNYPRSLVISESTYLQSIICLTMYLLMLMKPHLLGKMLETRIRWEFENCTKATLYALPYDWTDIQEYTKITNSWARMVFLVDFKVELG